MLIGVSVQNWKFTARNNRGGIRQESVPQSTIAYSYVCWHTFKKKIHDKEKPKQKGSFKDN
jgi:hypothetical protein